MTRHLRWTACVCLGALALGVPRALEAQETLLYVPYVNAAKGTVTLGDGTTARAIWRSTLTFFNNGSTPAAWRWVTAYGGGVALPDQTTDPYCQTSTLHAVPPGTGAAIGTCWAYPPTGGVALLVLGVTGQLVSHPTVSWIHRIENCPSQGGLDVPQGRVPLPQFTSPFPAGSTVISGDIDLGDTGVGSCASQNQRYPRRVNVTMFNLGDAPATFQIGVRAGVNSASTFYQQNVSIAAKEVLQVNSLPLNLADVAEQPGTVGDGTTTIWILITADQPFFSYVSTIFDNPEPGAMPMEVFPSRLQN